MGYAKSTAVPVGRSQEHIRQVLTKHKAEAFAFGESRERGEVKFQIDNRLIRISVPYPTPPKPGATQASLKTYEQVIRSRWRVLLLSIKAKLEAVEAGVTTLEDEFLAFVVLPNGSTVGREIAAKIELACRSGEMPLLMGPR